MHGALLSGLLLFAASVAAQPGPIGSEFQVNTYTTEYQGGVAIAATAAGRFVVAWGSVGQDGSSAAVVAQRYDAAGAPIGGEFQVNTYTTDLQAGPSIASDAAGNFVVTWTDRGHDGDMYGVFAQRFDTSGTPVGGEFQVNTYTTDDQSLPDVATYGAGNFIITWMTTAAQDGSSFGIMGQRFDAAGTPLGPEFQVNTYTTGNQVFPRVAPAGGGGFVVVWQGGNFPDVFAQRFDAAGAPLGAEFQVNTYTTGQQLRPSVASDAAGNFVIVWETDPGAEDEGVSGQRYDSMGSPVGAEFRVHTSAGGTPVVARVARDGVGNFLVAWTSQTPGSDGDGRGVVAQRYDAAGLAIGGALQVNTYTPGDQAFPAVAADTSGTFVVAWQSAKQDDDTFYSAGVFGKRLATALPASGKLRIRDHSDVTKRKLSAAYVLAAALPSAPLFDPATNGAFLHVLNPATGLDSACIDLPATAWTAVGDPGSASFVYSDPSYANGPCKRVVIKKGKYLRLVCAGAIQPLSYSLDEPMQGAVDVRLGSGGLELCTEFGSSVTRDDALMFSARRVDPPVGCGRPAVSCP